MDALLPTICSYNTQNSVIYLWISPNSLNLINQFKWFQFYLSITIQIIAILYIKNPSIWTHFLIYNINTLNESEHEFEANFEYIMNLKYGFLLMAWDDIFGLHFIFICLILFLSDSF